MEKRLLLCILYFIVKVVCLGLCKEQLMVDVLCEDLLKSQSSLRTMNPSECKFSSKSDRLTCTVRLMSESIPYNVTSVENTDYSSLVRVNLNYSFRFRVIDIQSSPRRKVQAEEAWRRCLVLTGVSFKRVPATTGEQRNKVLLPSRLFHLAANSALLGADSEVDAKPGIPVGVVTLNSDCSTTGASLNRSSGDVYSPASEGGGTETCVRTVGVALPEAAAQLDLALLEFNYSFSGAGFPDRSNRGKSVSRSLPTQQLQRLQLRGGDGVPTSDVEPNDFPALGAQATELDLSYTKGHNFSTYEPQTDGLRKVSLSHAGLREVPDFVRRQSALRGLALDGNSALVRAGGAAALRESLTGLNELQELQLAGVRTDALTSETLPLLPALLSLNMSGCGLRNIARDALSSVPALQRLDLSGNLLVNVPAQLATPCPRMRHLNLARNKLVRGPQLVLTLLHELDLSGNALQSVDDVVSSGRVVTLRMAHNIVRSVEGARFSTWTERVDLSHNLISNIGLRAARRDLDGIVALDLRGNRLDCASCAILELQTWLNQTDVLLMPEPASLMCGESGDLEDEDEGAVLGQRVLDVRLLGCTPAVDYALLVVAPLAALIAITAAIVALVCVRRAGWLGVCTLCTDPDASDA